MSDIGGVQGEALQKEPIGLGHRHLDGVVIDDLRTLVEGHHGGVVEGPFGVVGIVLLEDAVKRELDRLGGEGRAIVEGDPLAQLEGDGHGVRGDLPALRKAWLQLLIGVIEENQALRAAHGEHLGLELGDLGDVELVHLGRLRYANDQGFLGLRRSLGRSRGGFRRGLGRLGRCLCRGFRRGSRGGRGSDTSSQGR